MEFGVPRETFPGERRVALVPAVLGGMLRGGHAVRIEQGAGILAGFGDAAYQERGARLVGTRREALAAEVVLMVRTLGADPAAADEDLACFRPGQVVIGFCEPLAAPALCARLAETGASLLAMELVPRISRAQAMDALSSMATISGYRAALHAAMQLDKLFPLLMTAAGTITPARVLVLGAGVAGLQAIATARRLGAVVEAYDVRPEVKEQVQSLGAKFLELPLETGPAQADGYAGPLDENVLARQRELLAAALAEQQVVIATAAVPGQRAPRLLTAEMVARMQPGAVIIDLAAERGGNCELTRPGETLRVNGVIIEGPLNLPSEAPRDASQMYARNLWALLSHLTHEGRLRLEADDEIVRATLVAHEGKLVHPRVVEALQAASAGA